MLTVIGEQLEVVDLKDCKAAVWRLLGFMLELEKHGPRRSNTLDALRRSADLPVLLGQLLEGADFLQQFHASYANTILIYLSFNTGYSYCLDSGPRQMR